MKPLWAVIVALCPFMEVDRLGTRGVDGERHTVSVGSEEMSEEQAGDEAMEAMVAAIQWEQRTWASPLRRPGRLLRLRLRRAVLPMESRSQRRRGRTREAARRLPRA